MKFSTSKLELQKALQKLSKATPTRTTLPILGCVFIEATEEKTLLKTSLNQRMKAKMRETFFHPGKKK